jgi:hypothetical protein
MMLNRARSSTKVLDDRKKSRKERIKLHGHTKIQKRGSEGSREKCEEGQRRRVVGEQEWEEAQGNLKELEGEI